MAAEGRGIEAEPGGAGLDDCGDIPGRQTAIDDWARLLKMRRKTAPSVMPAAWSQVLSAATGQERKENAQAPPRSTNQNHACRSERASENSSPTTIPIVVAKILAPLSQLPHLPALQYDHGGDDQSHDKPSNDPQLHARCPYGSQRSDQTWSRRRSRRIMRGLTPASIRRLQSIVVTQIQA